MAEQELFNEFEESPHIELNQDASTIDLSNWHEPANRNWSYRHIVDIIPHSTRISRGEGPIQEFGSRPVDLSAVSVSFRRRDMKLEEYLHESHCDAFLVLQGNDIVFEDYRRMQADERHLIQSSTKTTVCSLMGGLIAEGTIDPNATIDEYIPTVSSGFKGVRVQDALDMNVALNFKEDFISSDSDIYDYEITCGWRTEERGVKASGLRSYLEKIEHDPSYDLDGVTNYLCPDTDMLGYVIEEVTGRRYVELFQDRVYRHIGAESDAYFLTDPTGMAVASGGLVLRLRDLARYAQTFANRGVANDGTQVIPESWISECLDQRQGMEFYMGDGYRYHNQMANNGEAFGHAGLGGQLLYANPTTGVVAVQFSTTTMPSQGDLDFGNALYGIGDAISDYLRS